VSVGNATGSRHRYGAMAEFGVGPRIEW
jgi:hypothetical protein